MIKTVIFLILISVFNFNFLFSQEDIKFPSDSGVIDITKSPYFAKGDGVTDNTNAINKAFRDHPDGQFIIYFPKGVYIVSDRIEWPRVSNNDINCGTEQSCRYTIMQGENKNGTIIKLKNNSPRYQNTSKPRSVIWTGLGAAQRFRNAIRNITINVGKNNPGAIGIQFKANNQGGIFDVNIVSEDRQGKIGLDFAYTNEIGPLLVKDVEILGFDTAIETNFNVNSITFENLSIKNQNKVGLFIKQQVINIRNLKSFNEVTAIKTKNQGSYVTIIDSELRGKGNASKKPAILYGNEIFIRNVKTSGYKNSLSYEFQGTTPVITISEKNIDEFVSKNPIKLCNNIEKSLNLTIKETPRIPSEPIRKWVNIDDYGANSNDREDDSDAIQKALNSGASTIFVPVSSFRNGRYIMNKNVTIPKTVKRFIGTEGLIAGTGRFNIIGGNQPLIIERFKAIANGVNHQAKRTLIIKNTIMRPEGYKTSGGADLFLEDVVLTDVTFKNQNVWARQFNSEFTERGVNILNNNSNLWILGLKTETRGTKIKTINGGKTEVLGGLIYSNGPASDDFLFVSENSSVSFSGIREANFNNNPYSNLILEKRGNISRKLVKGEADYGIGGSGFPLYVGYPSSSSNKPPVVNAGKDESITINEIFFLKGIVNDDGQPNQNCFVEYNWKQLSGNEVNFDSNEINPKINFAKSGEYKFRLSANDGEYTTQDDVIVSVYNLSRSTSYGKGADATIKAANKSKNNFGGDSDLQSREHPGIFDNKIYLRFDISDIDRKVNFSELNIEISTKNQRLIQEWEFNVFGLKELSSYGENKLNEFWAEGNKKDQLSNRNEINYDNAPGNILSGGGIYNSNNNSGGGVDNTKTIFLGKIKSRNGIREILELKSTKLSDLINSDTNGVITLIITRIEKNNNLFSFSSKENTTFSSPTLKIGLGSSENNLDIRAKGKFGKEKMSLLVNNKVLQTWTVSDKWQNYNYTRDLPNGNIKIRFDNDRPNYDLRVDYIKLKNTIIQSESRPINTGAWNKSTKACGKGFSEWLHCRGFIDFSSSNRGKTEDIISYKTSENINSCTLYPNPTNGANLKLSCSNYSFKEGANAIIIDYTGRILKSIEIKKRNAANNDPIDFTEYLKTLNSGSYFLKILPRNEKKKSLIIRFIKEE
ncbi:hypothetical protein GCM10009430_32390 [Aquimarina litoralis]|uniref:Por secretion system C-terminal sorting domain-containing protein n=1 Tax=Aquimarina litoralis TaxID=584605 RepID=A0ABP3UBK0_9FLAO